MVAILEFGVVGNRLWQHLWGLGRWVIGCGSVGVKGVGSLIDCLANPHLIQRSRDLMLYPDSGDNETRVSILMLSC